MLYIGVLKRVVPFFLMFAAGLFIASFFINIATPSFSFPRRSHKFREVHRLRDENRELKRSNVELRRQLDEARRSIAETNEPLELDELSNYQIDAPPPPPPMTVKGPRHPRFDK